MWTLDEEMHRVQVMELEVRHLFSFPFFVVFCSVKPGSQVLFLRVLIIIVRSSVVCRCHQTHLHEPLKRAFDMPSNACTTPPQP